MRDLVYIHGAGAEPADPPWSRLAPLLGDTWKVIAPSLGEPDVPRWMAGIDGALEEASPDAVFFAHSLGVSLLIQTIAARRRSRRAAGLVGLAAPFWEREDMAEYILPTDFPEALSGVERIVLFHSRDDEVVSPDHLAKWGKHLPQAELHELIGVDHVAARGDISPIAAAINAL